MGANPKDFGLGFPVDESNAARFEGIWGFRPPTTHGMTAVGMIDAAHAGGLDVLYTAGGNFLETLPEPDYVRDALARIPLRIHQDIVLTSAMLVDPDYAVLLFPAQTRYEQRGGGTQTSTERRVYFSPEVPGRRIGEARAEWEIFMQVGERVRPEASHLVHFEDGAAIRRAHHHDVRGQGIWIHLTGQHRIGTRGHNNLSDFRVCRRECDGLLERLDRLHVAIGALRIDPHRLGGLEQPEHEIEVVGGFHDHGRELHPLGDLGAEADKIASPH